MSEVMMAQNRYSLSQIGGARIGLWNFSFPFARLLANQNALALSCLGQNYVFLRDNIVSLARHRGLFSVGLRIDHRNSLYPKFIVFWVSPFRTRTHFTHLKRRLEALGYEVHE
jgi:hypothetical protein